MIFYGKVCKNNPNRNRIEETMNPLKEKLAESLVIFDGAIGTELIEIETGVEYGLY